MVPLDTACLSAETYPLALVTITSRTVGEIMFLAVGLILTNAEGDQCQLTFVGLWCGEKRTVTAGNSASHPLTCHPVPIPCVLSRAKGIIRAEEWKGCAN